MNLLPCCFRLGFLQERVLNPKVAKAEPQRQLTVCHVVSGDLWAGAEVQVASLLVALSQLQDLRVSAVLLNKGRLLDELSKAGIPVTFFDESQMNGWVILGELKAYFRKTKPHIIHSHRYKEHILCAIAAKLSHSPIVVQTFHGLEESLRGWAALKMATYVWLNTCAGRIAASGFVGVSGEIAGVLKRRFPAGEVRCIRNGIDLDKVKPRMGGPVMRVKLEIPADAFVVGTVCRLTPIKGIEQLLMAMALVAKNYGKQSKKLVIVGDGPLRTSLESLAQELGLAADTLFLGARMDVFDVMSTFDILALPSLHEGVPMVLLEAMALGVPIVASRVGGIPEIVQDDREGRLVPAQNHEVLAHAISELEWDPQLRERLRKAARERVESELSIVRTAALTREMYRDLMRSRAC